MQSKIKFSKILITAAVFLAVGFGFSVFARAATININGAIEHQTMVGLGGDMESHTAYENDSQFWDLLFNDLGASAVHKAPMVNYASSDAQETFPVLREAKNHGINYYEIQPLFYPASWHDASGYIIPQYYDDMANMIVNYANYIKQNTGVDIDVVCPIAEPTLGSSGTTEKFMITPSEYVNFLKVAGPIIRSGVGGLKIHVPCDWNIDRSIVYANAIKLDSTAMSYVDALSTHAYKWPTNSNSQKWQSFANIAQAYNKTTSCSEDWHCCGNPAPNPAGTYVAQWIHEAFVDGQAVSFKWWDMIDKGKYNKIYPYHEGLIYSKSWPPGEYSVNGITKEGYAFKQFAHWVRPDAIRIDASSDDANVLVSSFKHPTEKTFTIVAINKDTQAKTNAFNIANLNSISTLDAYRTSAMENTDNLGIVQLTNNSFSYNLPAQSITTFTGSMAGTDIIFPAAPQGLAVQ